MLDEEKLYKELGSNIQKIRKKQGLNQSDFAAKINLERTSITNIEGGKQKVTIFTLYKICQIFQIDISDILPRHDSVVTHRVETSNDSGVSIIGSKTKAVIERLKKTKE